MGVVFLAKTLATIALFVVFFVVFGMSSIQKYMLGHTVTVSTTKPNDEGLPPPTIMVCPEGEFGGAWKKNCQSYDFIEGDACSTKHMFTLNETINRTSVISTLGKHIRSINLSSWTPTYRTPYLGTCFTLQTDQERLKSGERLFIMFTLGTVKSHSIYLVDPDFFVMKAENSVIPFLLLDNPMSKVIYLHTTFTSRMNRPQFPCNPDKSYNYNQCIRNNLARKIGCAYPFDIIRPIGNFSNCNTSEELSAHWTANFDIYHANQEALTNITGCHLPCHYNHYSIVGTPRRYEVKGSLYMVISYPTTDMTTSQEVLLYPFDSLVSEFGGALGLFLGFSFLGLLDILQNACTNIMARLKMDQETFNLPDA